MEAQNEDATGNKWRSTARLGLVSPTRDGDPLKGQTIFVDRLDEARSIA